MPLSDSNMTISQEVNVVMESGISEVTKARLEEVLTEAGLTYSYSDAAVEGKTKVSLGINGSGEAAETYATAINSNMICMPSSQT